MWSVPRLAGRTGRFRVGSPLLLVHGGAGECVGSGCRCEQVAGASYLSCDARYCERGMPNCARHARRGALEGLRRRGQRQAGGKQGGRGQ